jgi:hypothetical protein
MKNFWNPNKITKIATTAVIGATVAFGAVSPAEARPSSVGCHNLDDGWTVCYQPVGYSSVNVVVNNPYKLQGFNANRNCDTGYVQWVDNDGFTKEQIFDLTRTVCNF